MAYEQIDRLLNFVFTGFSVYLGVVVLGVVVVLAIFIKGWRSFK